MWKYLLSFMQAKVKINEEWDEQKQKIERNQWVMRQVQNAKCLENNTDQYEWLMWIEINKITFKTIKEKILDWSITLGARLGWKDTTRQMDEILIAGKIST
jgi:hypothetical protein